MRLGGPVHLIMTKTLNKALLGGGRDQGVGSGGSRDGVGCKGGEGQVVYRFRVSTG